MKVGGAVVRTGLGIGVSGFGFMGSGSGFRKPGSGFRFRNPKVLGVEPRGADAFRAWDLGFRV